MGVPALFRWLSQKYPKIISPVIETDEESVDFADPSQFPSSYSAANPNGELDNLYLDMNGIVHPCTHPEHKAPPETEDEMFIDIFTYTDRVLNMARPRKLLMIAVDGVAPRAKMNQQRARRFRAAKEAQIQAEEKERQIKEKEARGEMIDEAIKGRRGWDSNAITPGTPFMDKLALALRYWTAYKLSIDPGWANLQVIISDATVPGEGEHKIMNFIRSQRGNVQYNPNTSHCIYGLDADLIFLALATHEPHFRVLREDVFARDRKTLNVSDHLNMTDEQRERIKSLDSKKPFLWLHVNVLREYLEVELNIPRLQFNFDLERAIDDWVFMCFFVGNDFLPHLPSLDVRDNGIDILVGIWKRLLPQLKSYITCDGNLSLEGVERLMSHLSAQEDEIFRKRREFEKRREDNDKRRRLVNEDEQTLKQQYLSSVSKGREKAPLAPNANIPLYAPSGELVGGSDLTNKEIVQNRNNITMAGLSDKEATLNLKNFLDSKKGLIKNGVKEEQEGVPTNDQDMEEVIKSSNNANISAAAALKKQLLSNGNSSEAAPQQNSFSPSDAVAGEKRKFDSTNGATTSGDVDENGDSVRLWEPGYNKRYYESKFHTTNQDEIAKIKRDMVVSYIEGISWVLLYYYQGCPSWQWYYPFHYAPFASDFKDLSTIEVKFVLGKPFAPFEQLMSVLPAASGHNLPEVFRPLMSHPDSEIIDFYPEEFEIDMNGKKMSWQGIALLPFIDENRLLASVRKKYEELTDSERDRNATKQEVLFISSQNVNYKKFTQKLYDESVVEVNFDFAKSGLAGTVFKTTDFQLQGVYKNPVKEGNLPDLHNGSFLKLLYKMPSKKHGKSMLLTGYVSHEKALTQQDKDGIMYGSRNRFRSPKDNTYVNKGPAGDSMFTMRAGGYKSFIVFYEHQAKQLQMQQQQRQMMNGFGGSRPSIPPPSKQGFLARNNYRN